MRCTKQSQSIQGLAQKSNDLFSFYGSYKLTHSFHEIIRSLKLIPSAFTIITPNNKFKCHLEIAASVSGKIFNDIESNPELYEFSLNKKFDDSMFNQFSDFLNGIPVQLNDSNRKYFKYVFQELEIDQSLINIDLSKELDLRPFIKQFYNILPNINNKISLTNDNGEKYRVNYLLASTYCHILKDYQQVNRNEININIDISDDISDIADFLNGNSLNIVFEDYDKIKQCFSKLQIELFDVVLNQIHSKFESLNPIISFINLQDTILSINKNNTNSIFELLKASDFLADPKMHQELFQAIEISFTYRPRYYQNVMDLLLLLINDSDNLHDSLISYLLSRYRFQAKLSIPFLRMIYDAQIITLDEVLNIIIAQQPSINFGYSYEERNRMQYDTLRFFLHELYDHNQKMLSELETTIQYYNSNKVKELKNYIDNWDEYHALMHLYHRSGDLCTSIFNDDVDTLQTITSLQPEFDYNQNLKPSLFEPFQEIDCDISLADLAAFYGSIKCFKFLKLQHADISRSGKFALFGGNYEIVRLVEQDGNGFSDLFYCAVKYHHFSLFRWLCDNHGPMGELYRYEYTRGKSPLIPLSIMAYNYRVFLYFFEKGIKDTSDDDVPLISIAISSLNVNALKLLILIHKVTTGSINDEDDDDEFENPNNPIFLAAACNSTEMMKILIESKKCCIPKCIDSNPLFEAIKNGNVEMVDLLAPYYKDVINKDYIERIRKINNDQQIIDIITKYQK